MAKGAAKSAMTRPLSSKDFLIALCGLWEVQAYELVKERSMQLGQILAEALLARVGGRVAVNGEECDGVTKLGKWEFCLQKNTKNHAGNRADLLRHPGHCVQILGSPNPGWLSASEFLEMHDVAGDELEWLVVRALEAVPKHTQQRFLV